MHFITVPAVIAALLFSPIDAYSIVHKHHNILSRRGGDPAAQLSGMLANPNTCPTSSGECVTPKDAVGPIINGLNAYGILTAAEQAAVVSWMAFESGDFKYDHNISPGRPGQGTRAMLMPNYVKLYIDSMPQMASEAAATGGDPTKLLALVQDNAHSFAAASWFYSSQCSDAVKAQVKTGTQAGWAAFIGTCVNTDAQDAGRIAYWKRACQQLSVSTS